MKARRSNGDGAIDKVKRARKDGTVVERWRGRIRLGIDRRTGKNRRVTLYADTRSELATKMARLQADASRGIVPSSERMSVAAYMQRWLDDAVKPSVRQTTHRQYEGVVRVHIAPRIGKVQLDKLSPADVQHLLSSLERNGASARMRQLVYAVLHRALGQALRWDMVFRNVAQNAARPRVQRREMLTLNAEQARLLLSVAAETEWHALFVLAIATGMRQGELLALRWPDVDLDAAALSVRHTLSNIDGKMVLADPKTAKSRRRIELPPMAVAALREHQRRLFARGLRAVPWVFPSEAGGPQDAQNLMGRVFRPLLTAVQAEIDKEATAAGREPERFPAIRFHDLRHTAASLMLERGLHPKVVSEVLGHSTVAMTLDVYSHVVPSMQREAAARMDALLSGA
jgi:integrase